MSEKKRPDENIVNGRISILFFHLLLMGALLWAERTAYYRYDYVFRKMLPMLLPILLVAALAGGIFCLIAARKKESEKLFSPSFGAYLLAAPIIAFLLPLLSYLGKGLQMFKLATESAFYLLIGYFLCYILYEKVHRKAGFYCGLITAEAVLSVFYYEMQLSLSTGILNAPEFGYLTPIGQALLHGAILLGITLLFWIFTKRGALEMKKWEYFAPLCLCVLYMGIHLAVSFAFSVRQILLWCFLGLCAVLLGIFCWNCRKKK